MNPNKSKSPRSYNALKKSVIIAGIGAGVLTMSACDFGKQLSCDPEKTTVEVIPQGASVWQYANEVLTEEKGPENFSENDRFLMIEAIKNLNDDQPLIAGQGVTLPLPGSCA